MNTRPTALQPVRPTEHFADPPIAPDPVSASKASTEASSKDGPAVTKSPFTHPKSAPVRAEDEAKKQHFVFLGNLMAAPDSREVVLARQKQYFEELSRQVQEKGKLQTKCDDYSMHLSTELQPLPPPQDAVPYTRFRKKHEIENHLALQVQGSSVYGGVLQRDEVALIRKKKEEQQREIQDALKKQIEEKAAKKLAERQARIQQEVFEEQLLIQGQSKAVPPQPSPPRPPDLQLPSEDSTPLLSTQSPVANGHAEIDLLNAKFEEMKKSNMQLMEQLKEQHALIAQIREQKPARSRVKPGLSVALPVDTPQRKQVATVKPPPQQRKKELPRGRQTSGIFRQSTYEMQSPPSPMVIAPRMQSAFASGGVSPLQCTKPAVALNSSKVSSNRVFFTGGTQYPVEPDARQNLDTAGESHFIYPTQDGQFYPSGKDELDRLIESEKLGACPSIPELGQSHSQWVPVAKVDLGHRSQMSYVTDYDGGKVNRFPRDVFATIPRKRP